MVRKNKNRSQDWYCKKRGGNVGESSQASYQNYQTKYVQLGCVTAVMEV